MPKEGIQGMKKKILVRNSECWLPVPAPLLTHHVTPTDPFPSLTYSSSVKPSDSQQPSSTSISLPPWLIVFLHPLGEPNIMLPPLFPHPLCQTQVLMGACGWRVGEEIPESSAQLRTLGSFLATFSKAHNLSLIT